MSAWLQDFNSNNPRLPYHHAAKIKWSKEDIFSSHTWLLHEWKHLDKTTIWSGVIMEKREHFLICNYIKWQLQVATNTCSQNITQCLYFTKIQKCLKIYKYIFKWVSLWLVLNKITPHLLHSDTINTSNHTHGT